MDPRNALHPDNIERDKRSHIPFRRYMNAEDALRAVAYAVQSDSDIWNYMPDAIKMMQAHFKEQGLCPECGFEPVGDMPPVISHVNPAPYECNGCKRVRYPVRVESEDASDGQASKDKRR